MTTLFHVTREGLADNIWREGVSWRYATGKLPVSWWSDRENVVWSLAHVSQRWSVSVDRLVVVEAEIAPELVHRWSTPGLYYVRVIVRVAKLWGYEHFLKPEI